MVSTCSYKSNAGSKTVLTTPLPYSTFFLSITTPHMPSHIWQVNALGRVCLWHTPPKDSSAFLVAGCNFHQLCANWLRHLIRRPMDLYENFQFPLLYIFLQLLCLLPSYGTNLHAEGFELSLVWKAVRGPKARVGVEPWSVFLWCVLGDR